MSGRAMEWAAELATDKRLDATTAYVLVRLAYHANSRTGRAWPAVDTLAYETGLHVRTVQRALAALERRRDPDTGEVAGYVDTVRRRGYTTIWLFPQCPQTRPQPAGGVAVSTGGVAVATVGGGRVPPDPGVSRREPGALCDERGIFLPGSGWIRE